MGLCQGQYHKQQTPENNTTQHGKTKAVGGGGGVRDDSLAKYLYCFLVIYFTTLSQ
jgi:hypothetical protein